MMFGKRKPKPDVKLSAARTAPSPPGIGPSQGAGRLGTVIVPRSAIERARDPEQACELVQSVVDFVNAMGNDGLYSRFEIPAVALRAYHADFYLAQVNNGGHSQFIHNCHGNLDHVLADVRAGLAAMQAMDHLTLFEQMAAWIKDHPGEASQQTGFNGGRAPLLDTLDAQFHAANRATPMIQLSAKWIASWPELRVVDDADYGEAIGRIAMLNPLREARLMMRSVANIRQQMTEWFQVGIGLACATIPEIEMKLAIGGGSTMEVEGEQQTAFHVRTTASAPRFGVVTDHHAAVYERVEPGGPPMPELGDVAGMGDAIRDRRLRRYQPARIGARLARVEAATISGMISLAKDYQAAVALDLLLRQAGIDPAGAAVAPLKAEPHANGTVANWLVAAGGQFLYLMATPNGAALLRPADTAHLATARKADIEAHAALANAGAVEPAAP